MNPRPPAHQSGALLPTCPSIPQL
ncbi:rCG63566 [Rattus norvegicus]|uniref:RCG63566 n=1 Tax=Rattus norvegicus TaxID=10116 RepID=A6IVT4_RAT|nr:rCG63566 [Rattus norvegicus]